MNLKDIPITNNIDYDNHLNELEGGEDIYQFQPMENKGSGSLMLVGKTLHHSDIMINKFAYKKKIKCHLVSCLYNNNELSDIQSECIFPILKLNIFTEEKKYTAHKCKTKLKLRETLQYNFHTYKHLQNKIQSKE